jgi:signal transduction histidine kinase
MKEILKILHLEDLPDDAELVARVLKKAGLKFEAILTENKNDFINALKEFSPDIILSDHSLSSFDSQEALKIVREMGINVPFILVTATVSEEYAVSIIKEGAADYILKDRLQRLPNAIQNAIEKYDLEKKRRHAEKELALQRILQQKLIAETGIQAQEKEREKIGRELHDNINQILAASVIYLSHAIKTEIPDPDSLQKTGEYISLAIEEIRKLSHELVAPSLKDISLIQAVEDLLLEIRTIRLLHARLIIGNFYENGISHDKKLMLYRVIQEQISNILKHANAKNISVQLTMAANRILLSVTDDGRGFDTSMKAEGIGLKNIRNRVEFFDGAVRINSAPGKGCTLEVNVSVQ